MSAGVGDMGEAVLRLVIKGMNPAEAQRLASQTFGALEAELHASMARQTEAHRKAAEAQTTEAQKAAKEEVKASRDATKAIVATMNEIEREAKRAANATANQWRRTLEDMENVTVVVTGIKDALVGTFNIIKGSYETFKRLGEEIIRTSNIFGSLKGSIADAREAVQGTVTDMDLIMAKNRAMEMDLELTDKQFATVAAQADRFADSIGVNGKEAMDKLIQALATGENKLLKRAGILIDVSAAEKKFADGVGKTVEQLTDEEKKTAFQVAALAKMDAKFNESASNVVTFGLVMEQTFVKVKNSWDHFMADVGNMKIGENRAAYEDLEDPSGVAGIAADDMRARNARRMAARAARDAAVASRLRAGDDPLLAANGGDMSGDNPLGASAAQGVTSSYVGAGTGPAGTKAIGGGRKGGGTKYDLLSDYLHDARARMQQESDAADQAYQDALKLVGGNANEGAAQAGIDKAGMSAFGGTYTEDEQKQFLKAQEAAIKGAERRLQDIVAFTEETKNELKDQAGELGLMGLIFFGPDGPDQLYEQMDEAGRAGFDAVKMMNEAGKAMAGALAESYVAWASGEKGFRAQLKESTREVLRNLAIRAAQEGAMKAAQAAGALAEENYVGAAKLAAASAGYFALAGGIAYASGQLASTPAGAKPTVSSTPKFASLPSTRGGERSTGNVTLNVSVAPGGEEAAGRSILDALLALKAQTGIDISKRLSNG